MLCSLVTIHRVASHDGPLDRHGFDRFAEWRSASASSIFLRPQCGGPLDSPKGSRCRNATVLRAFLGSPMSHLTVLQTFSPDKFSSCIIRDPWIPAIASLR